MQLNEIHDSHEHASTSLKTILLVFAIVLVGTLGYLVWDFNRTADTTDFTTPIAKKKTETTTTTTITDETKDWKTYSYATQGFSIKYPSNWYFTEETQGEGFVILTNFKYPCEVDCPGHLLETQTKMVIQSRNNPNKLSVEEFAEEIIEDEGSATVISKKELTVSGLKAIKCILSDTFGDLSNVFISSSGKIFQITTYSNQEFVDQMIATIKLS